LSLPWPGRLPSSSGSMTIFYPRLLSMLLHFPPLTFLLSNFKAHLDYLLARSLVVDDKGGERKCENEDLVCR